MRKAEPGVARDPKRGSWMFVVDAPGAERKRRQVKRRGFPTMEAANDAARAFRRQVDDGKVVVPDRDSVAEFARAWVAALPAEGIEAATTKHYHEAISRLLPTIGTLPLQAVTALDLDRSYSALLDLDRSARTVRASHVAAKKMLNEAVRVGKVARNVATDARPPRARAARAKTFPTWDLEQTERFLTAIADTPDATLWHVAAFTGMRRGELVAVRWEDVDLARSTITVCRSVGKGLNGVHTKSPKSDAGRRTVELDPPLVEILKAHRKAQTERRLALGSGWRDNDLVFSEVDGSAIHPDRCSKRWSDLVRRHAPALGLPNVRLHDLRHGHCSQLLDAGVRVDIVTERLGHASVAFTLSTYAHREEGDQRAGLAKLRAVR